MMRGKRAGKIRRINQVGFPVFFFFGQVTFDPFGEWEVGGTTTSGFFAQPQTSWETLHKLISLNLNFFTGR